MKMQHATAAALLLALGFAGSAGAAPALRDFGPIAVTADETVRLVIKQQDGRPFGFAAPGCSLRTVVAVGNAPGPATLISLTSGASKTIDIDPARMGPPSAPPNMACTLANGCQTQGGAAPLPGYIVSALLGFEPAPIATASLCEKSVTASVLVIDRATGGIRRVDDTFTETH